MMVGRRSRIRHSRGTAVGLAGTVVVHVAAGGFLVAGATARQPLPPVYRVSLVAAPRPEPARRPAAAEPLQRAAEQPPPAPSRQPTRTPPVPAPRRPLAAPKEPPPKTAPRSVEPLPGERPSTGRDVANVETPGVEFPFSDYLEQMVAEVYRRWQRPEGGQLEAEVQFFVHRDGSVSNLHITRRSGSYGFDLEAQAAIETAGRSRAFGPLPDAYAADILPVTFFFKPLGGR